MHRKISCKVDTPNTHIRLLPGLVQALQYKGAGVKLVLRPHKIFDLLPYLLLFISFSNLYFKCTKL